MSSWSDRQSSTVTVLGWFGARMVERNVPPESTSMRIGLECLSIRGRIYTKMDNSVWPIGAQRVR